MFSARGSKKKHYRVVEFEISGRMAEAKNTAKATLAPSSGGKSSPASDDKDTQMSEKPIFKWLMSAVEDLKLAKGDRAKSMCLHFQSVLREFVSTLQNTESRERIKKSIPKPVFQTVQKILPRMAALLGKRNEQKQGQSDTTTSKRSKLSKKKNPTKVINKSIKKIISAIKSIRRSELDTFVNALCAETKFKTPDKVISECSSAMQKGGVNSSDIRNKMRSKVVSMMRGQNAASILSKLVSGNEDSGGSIGQIMNIAHEIMGTNGAKSSAQKTSNVSKEPKGVFASLLRGFVKSQKRC